jgi:hypothetical protein
MPSTRCFSSTRTSSSAIWYRVCGVTVTTVLVDCTRSSIGGASNTAPGLSVPVIFPLARPLAVAVISNAPAATPENAAGNGCAFVLLCAAHQRNACARNQVAIAIGDAAKDHPCGLSIHQLTGCHALGLRCCCGCIRTLWLLRPCRRGHAAANYGPRQPCSTSSPASPYASQRFHPAAMAHASSIAVPTADPGGHFCHAMQYLDWSYGCDVPWWFTPELIFFSTNSCNRFPAAFPATARNPFSMVSPAPLRLLAG